MTAANARNGDVIINQNGKMMSSGLPATLINSAGTGEDRAACLTASPAERR